MLRLSGVSPRRLAVYAALPVVVALPVLLLHAFHYMPYMSDDSLIVARYAERLIEGRGLTWTDGERVEGYSNLLWVLLIAGVGERLPGGIAGLFAMFEDVAELAEMSLPVAGGCLDPFTPDGQRGAAAFEFGSARLDI